MKPELIKNFKKKTFNVKVLKGNGSVVGFIEYHDNGEIAVVSQYSIETSQDNLNYNSFILSQFKHRKKVLILDGANIWE